MQPETSTGKQHVSLISVSLQDIGYLNNFDKEGFYHFVRSAKIPNYKKPVAIKQLKSPPPEPHSNKDTPSSNVIWIELKHRNLVRVLGLCEKPSLLVMELIETSLRDILVDCSRYDISLGIWEIFRIISDVARGLEYLHGKHIVHTGIRPEHILLNKTMNAKITSLNHCQCIDTHIQPSFIPPPRLEWYCPPKDRRISVSFDVWSFGVTILEMVKPNLQQLKCDRTSRDFTQIAAEILTVNSDSLNFLKSHPPRNDEITEAYHLYQSPVPAWEKNSKKMSEKPELFRQLIAKQAHINNQTLTHSNEEEAWKYFENAQSLENNSGEGKDIHKAVSLYNESSGEMTSSNCISNYTKVVSFGQSLLLDVIRNCLVEEVEKRRKIIDIFSPIHSFCFPLETMYFIKNMSVHESNLVKGKKNDIFKEVSVRNLSRTTFGTTTIRALQQWRSLPILNSHYTIITSEETQQIVQKKSRFHEHINCNPAILSHPVLNDDNERYRMAEIVARIVLDHLKQKVLDIKVISPEKKDGPCNFFVIDTSNLDMNVTAELMCHVVDSEMKLLWKVHLQGSMFNKLAFVDGLYLKIDKICSCECARTLAKINGSDITINQDFVGSPQTPDTTGPYCIAGFVEGKYETIIPPIPVKAKIQGDLIEYDGTTKIDESVIAAFVHVSNIAKILEPLGFQGYGAFKGETQRVITKCTFNMTDAEMEYAPDLRLNKNPQIMLGRDYKCGHTALDEDSVFHEYMHAVLVRILGGASFKEEACALAEGICDFFPCAYYEKDVFCQIGDATRYYTENKIKLRSYQKVQKDNPHQFGMVLCSALIKMNRLIGDKTVSMKMVLDALRCCGSLNPTFLKFRDCLLFVSTNHIGCTNIVWNSFAYLGMGFNAVSVPEVVDCFCTPWTPPSDDCRAGQCMRSDTPPSSMILPAVNNILNQPGVPLVNQYRFNPEISSKRVMYDITRLILRHDGESRDTNQTAVATLPISEEMSYFEVNIRHINYDDKIVQNTLPVVAIGIGPEDFQVETKLPGWTQSSFGFHTDDGMFYLQSPFGTDQNISDSKKYKHIGCGVTRENVLYIFLIDDQNSQVFESVFYQIPLDTVVFGKLFPMIGLDTTKIKINFGQQPFLKNTISTKFCSPTIVHDICTQQLTSPTTLSTPTDTSRVYPMAKWNQPFSENNFNTISVKIVNLGEVGIGLTTSEIIGGISKGKRGSCMWYSDGSLWNKKNGPVYVERFGVGDDVGCEVEWITGEKSKVKFTKNGSSLANCSLYVSCKHKWFPTVVVDGACVIYKSGLNEVKK